MALFEFNGYNQTSPPFIAQQLVDYLVPAGGLLDTTGLTANAQGYYELPAGTLVGRTYAERDAGAKWGLADVATDEEIYLTADPVYNSRLSLDLAFVKPGTSIKENKLPGWASMTAPQKAKIRSLYNCISGAN